MDAQILFAVLLLAAPHDADLFSTAFGFKSHDGDYFRHGRNAGCRNFFCLLGGFGRAICMQLTRQSTRTNSPGAIL